VALDGTGIVNSVRVQAKVSGTGMNGFLNVSTIILRICYVVQIVLGILLWTDNGGSLRGLHMLLGIVIVLGLWATGVALAVRGGSPALAAPLIIYGIIVIYVGLQQEQWLPGASHWIIQVVHLLLGLGTMALTETTRRRVRMGSAAVRHA
jgi:hypothetical protein